MVTMRWGTLKPARVASLGTGKELVFPYTVQGRCQDDHDHARPEDEPEPASPFAGSTRPHGAPATQLGVGRVFYRQGRPLPPTQRVRRIEPTG